MMRVLGVRTIIWRPSEVQQLFVSVELIKQIEIASCALFHPVMVRKLIGEDFFNFADSFLGMTCAASFAVLHFEQMRALLIAANLGRHNWGPASFPGRRALTVSGHCWNLRVVSVSGEGSDHRTTSTECCRH